MGALVAFLTSRFGESGGLIAFDLAALILILSADFLLNMVL